jgi:hypothetical protein
LLIRPRLGVSVLPRMVVARVQRGLHSLPFCEARLVLPSLAARAVLLLGLTHGMRRKKCDIICNCALDALRLDVPALNAARFDATSAAVEAGVSSCITIAAR